MDEQAMELAMTIVAQAGDARSSCKEAIAFAKKGQFEQAEQTLQLARSRLSAVHEIQTDLIRAEVEQKPVALTLLMVHAQDHLTMATLMYDLAKEFCSLYQVLENQKSEGKL